MPSEKRARQRALRDLKVAAEEQRVRRRKGIRRGLIALVVAGAIVGIVFGVTSSSGPKTPAASKQPTTSVPVTSSTQATPTSSTQATPTTAPVSHTAIAPTCPPASGATKRVIAFTKAPPTCISTKGVYDAKVVTDVGTFVIRMNAAASPAAVNSFVFLARYHFFNGIVFHRVIPGFVVQGGDPTGTGTGGPGYSFTGNTPPKSCTAKADCYPVWGVALANSSGPATDGSQFFIILPGGQKTLDQEPNYTLFGKVVSGTSVVAKIGAAGSSGGTPKVLHYMKSVTISQVSG
ncbi:MAG: peptidylprolyl isomerase [Actinomycetota bacterium]|nr:peptidylprolyl isomerase [Actinomycetota bacterium]